MGVSRDAEHYGEVENVVTSCFAWQTGSASIFLPVIDWLNGEGYNVAMEQTNQIQA